MLVGIVLSGHKLGPGFLLLAIPVKFICPVVFKKLVAVLNGVRIYSPPNGWLSKLSKALLKVVKLVFTNVLVIWVDLSNGGCAGTWGFPVVVPCASNICFKFSNDKLSLHYPFAFAKALPTPLTIVLWTFPPVPK